MWQTVLDQLRLQMTKDTFSSLLAGTVADEPADGELRVHVGNERTREWLDNRLRSVVGRSVAGVYGQPLEIKFVTNGVRPVEVEPEPIEVEEAQVEVDPLLINLLQTWKKRFVKHPRHISLFWSIYFSRHYRFAGPAALQVWTRLRDAYDTNEGETGWTPVRSYTVKYLVETTGCTYQKISGVVRNCGAFRKHLEETGEPLPRCCGRYRGANLGNSEVAEADWPEGRPTCRYRLAGVLEVLAREGWLVFTKYGTSRRNTYYELQVYRYPPLLTPAQARYFSDAARRDYEDFLQSQIGVSLDDWRSIKAENLMNVWFEPSGLSLDLILGDDVLSLFARKDIFLCAD